MLARLNKLIPLSASYAVSVKLLLPLDFFHSKFGRRKLKPTNKIKINFNLLNAVAGHLFGSVNNNLFDKFIYHNRCKLRKIGVFFRKLKKLLNVSGIFFKNS